MSGTFQFFQNIKIISTTIFNWFYKLVKKTHTFFNYILQYEITLHRNQLKNRCTKLPGFQRIPLWGNPRGDHFFFLKPFQGVPHSPIIKCGLYKYLRILIEVSNFNFSTKKKSNKIYKIFISVSHPFRISKSYIYGLVPITDSLLILIKQKVQDRKMYFWRFYEKNVRNYPPLGECSNIPVFTLPQWVLIWNLP